MTTGKVRVIFSLLLVTALVGAAAEVRGRFEELEQWWRGPAELRDELLYGPYREVFSVSESHLPPNATLLLFSDWDPALLPYYLYPRKIYQVEVDPETNQDFMKLPPSSYPRRRPESFAPDWVVGLHKVDGAMVPEFLAAGLP